MKIASIVPMKNVINTYDGDYAMLLAHLKGYYPDRSVNPNCYVIMDNSLIELGGAVSMKDVYEAAVMCDVDELVLPDVFRNSTATVKSVQESIKWLRDNDRLGKFRLMAVCQGATEEEFAKCFKILENIPEIHCIGIPKVSEELTRDGRPGLEYLWQGCNKEIHLLGCWTNLSELRQYKYPARIRSCDTCIPALLACRHVGSVWEDRPEKTIDLIEDQIDFNFYNRIVDQLVDERLM